MKMVWIAAIALCMATGLAWARMTLPRRVYLGLYIAVGVAAFLIGLLAF